MPHVSVYRGDALVSEYSFADQDLVAIGRASTNDIVLGDPERKVSRYHAALVRARDIPDRYFVRDLGSRYSLRVDGQLTERRLLEDNDVVEIASYRLLFNDQRGGKSPTLLRVVPKRTASTAFEGSTVGLTDLGSRNPARQSQPRKEFLDQLGQATGRAIDLRRYAATMMPALCSVTRSDRGFLRMFASGGALPHLDLGIVGLRSEQAIEISDPDFMATLSQGHPVHEGTVFLLPLVNRKKTIGFLSLERVFPAEAFSPDDVDFLVAAGRTLSPVLAEALSGSIPAHASDDCRWPQEPIGNSKRLQDVRRQIRQAASNNMNVLILGATGTGKELVARGIHTASNRTGPFIAQNVGQTTETLAEAMIFGYAPKSGIAGADPRGVPGWFELADRGTLFLDEIHRLTASMQDKFLRVLQDKEVLRIGSLALKKIDVKVLAATDCDIDNALEEGMLRQAFYFRFGQLIRVPLLRERPEDIPLLAYYFLDTLGERSATGPKSISHRAMECLVRYDWPGNVRELEHCIVIAAGREGDVLFSWDLPEHLQEHGDKSETANIGSDRNAARQTPRLLEEVERDKIMEALESTRGNKTRAAEILGISRMTIINKMDKYKILRTYGDPRSEAVDHPYRP